MATRKPRAGAKKTAQPATPKSTAKTAAKKTAAESTAKSTAQKPLATGDVDQFPKHVFRADMGEGLPDQKSALNPNRAK